MRRNRPLRIFFSNPLAVIGLLIIVTFAVMVQAANSAVSNVASGVESPTWINSLAAAASP